MTDFLPAADYLPHEEPMLLVERVSEVTAESAVCHVRIDTHSVVAPFLNAAGNLPGWYALEIMAQTIGVWSGWHAHCQGKPPSVGLLLGCRGLTCSEPSFNHGTELEVRISLLLQDERIGSFECQILIDQTQVAAARLTTYQPNNNEISPLLARN
ncbi:ApeP family dehydratase [Biostraticola tofi]|uniref:Putative hotdog family 3-hydroxylacyl-ACP dehydratase n=1 Tax=Biostraticola tofi TaxID=466109 RepID=A0A4R3YUH9_9GAMM|nr:3-hydroxy-fatty acyl-ACP dehydratase [Biostraticola tofi]TCV95428.1 putative hotdog family 3-hydroxylacyl-ACP dehydratase [Biostraticola tofi]